MPRLNTFFVSHNFEVQTQYYGHIGWHANNCSLIIGQQLVLRCNDGWLAVGRLSVFYDASESKNDGKDFDFVTEFRETAESVFNKYNHSMFIDSHSGFLHVMQYIKTPTDHFYKKGQFNLREDTNRYDVSTVDSDFPHLIDGWISP